jgi:hypothetical protein
MATRCVRDPTTVPTGVIIELDDEPRGPGLIEIRIEGKTFLAFLRDIEERAERLEAN